MKLTLLFLTACFLQVSATVYSQNTKFTFDVKNKRVVDILRDIEDQSEFRFFYQREQVDVERKIDLDITEQTVENILTQIFNEVGVEFQVRNDNLILLKPVGMTYGMYEYLAENGQQQRTVSGTVTDNSDQPLPGVTVVIKGTTQGTVTNSDGEYSLSNIPEDATLVFSFVGMLTQEVVVGNQTSINVTLEPDVIGIEEVVAIGYGTVRKSDLTGSVKRVNVEELTELPNVSVMQGMQGTVPGLNIGAINQAGQNPTISIRGQNTISGSAGNNAPLIVVDGIIYRGSIVDLNTNDIESIDILKDASSAAIYGSQASNGVMIITTKRGKEIGKPVISYHGSYTLQVPSNKLEPMNGDELTDFLNDLFWDQGSRIGPDYIQPNPDFSFTPYFRNSQIANNFSNGVENDWWGLLTGNGSINSHNISLRGRNESLNYFLSGGLTDVEGFMKNEEYSRINYRINLDAKVVDWMNVGIESFFTTIDYSGVSPGINTSFTMYPWAPIYDENGEYALTPENLGLNPFLEIQQDDSDKRTNLFANIHSDIKLPFIKGFNYRINFSQNYRTTNQDRFNPWGANYTGSGYKNSYLNYDWSLDNIITYKKLFQDHHNLNVTLVYGIEERQYSYTQSSAQNFTNPLLGYNRLQAGDPSLNSVTSGKERENSLYTMGRLFYNYKDKYLITGTIRRDGFSGFGATKKIGVFPSIALGWVLSEESFMQDKTNWLNYLKIRTSYGSSGRRGVRQIPFKLHF